MVSRAMSPYYVSWMTGILSLVLGLDRVLHGLNGNAGWVECYLASVTIDWLCAICDSDRHTIQIDIQIDTPLFDDKGFPHIHIHKHAVPAAFVAAIHIVLELRNKVN